MNEIKDALIKDWGSCLDCDYEGLLEYRHLEGEDYGDGEALGVMLLQRCPACESEAHSLIPIDYYRELLELLIEQQAAVALGLREGADE